MKQSTKETIWISESLSNPSIRARMTVLSKGVSDSAPYWDENGNRTAWGDELERNDAIQNKYESGLPLKDDERPRAAYGNYVDLHIRKLQHFFAVNAYIVVSSDFARVLSGFDLGAGGLYPIELWQGNRTDRIKGDWFFLEFGQKRAFLPDRSTGGFKKPNRWPDGLWMSSLPKEGQIAVGASALEGPDLWIDPALYGSFFMNGRVEAVLKSASLTRTVRRARCTIVEQATGASERSAEQVSGGWTHA